MPGAAIHAFCDPVTTRSRPHSSIANGTAPSAEIASTRIRASGAASRTAAASAGMSLVTPVDVSLWVSSTALRSGVSAAAARTAAGCGAVAPLDLEPRDRRAVDLGDLREPVAERAHRDGEDPVAGRERVDDGGLETARAGAGQHDHVVLRAEERLHALADALQERLELLAAVVDHLPPAGLADGRRQGGGAGDAEVGLEAGHGQVSWVAGGSRPRMCPT